MTEDHKDYLAYRRSHRKRFGSSNNYMTFEEWNAAAEKEAEQDNLDYNAHIRAMTCSSRYL